MFAWFLISIFFPFVSVSRELLTFAGVQVTTSLLSFFRTILPTQAIIAAYQPS